MNGDLKDHRNPSAADDLLFRLRKIDQIPSLKTCPPRIVADLDSNRKIESPVTVLPQPVSPTTPNISPD